MVSFEGQSFSTAVLEQVGLDKAQDRAEMGLPAPQAQITGRPRRLQAARRAICRQMPDHSKYRDSEHNELSFWVQPGVQKRYLFVVTSWTQEVASELLRNEH